MFKRKVYGTVVPHTKAMYKLNKRLIKDEYERLERLAKDELDRVDKKIAETTISLDVTLTKSGCGTNRWSELSASDFSTHFRTLIFSSPNDEAEVIFTTHGKCSLKLKKNKTGAGFKLDIGGSLYKKFIMELQEWEATRKNTAKKYHKIMQEHINLKHGEWEAWDRY